ncbi:hypothetical protein [Streptomyces sp. NPDC097640]|uniref:hypothetical protein n=1 Tax=Streptomyces sp. NPDC097640 TaxID=3157229 RepID=UPI003333FD3E
MRVQRLDLPDGLFALFPPSRVLFHVALIGRIGHASLDESQPCCSGGHVLTHQHRIGSQFVGLLGQLLDPATEGITSLAVPDNALSMRPHLVRDTAYVIPCFIQRDTDIAHLDRVSTLHHGI